MSPVLEEFTYFIWPDGTHLLIQSSNNDEKLALALKKREKHGIPFEKYAVHSSSKLLAARVINALLANEQGN
jgi:hypothetical protein